MGDIESTSAEVPPVTRIQRLPDWYNPNVDQGRMAVELFLGWEEPPERVEVRRDEAGHNIALAYGGFEMSI